MKRSRFLVDGRFLLSMSTGVDRYAYQILKELDKICSDLDIAILVPKGANKVPKYNNISVIQSHFSKFWTQGIFAVNALIRRAVPINFCNEVSMLAPKGYVALHDVCYAEENDFFPEEERQWFLKIYGRMKKHSKKIITVSEFSKQRIVELLNIPEEKIIVAGNGWQHFNDVEPDETVFEKYPSLKKGSYYFVQSSANKNKNVAWVFDNARRFPDNQYVIGGKNMEKAAGYEELPNVICTGFLTDGPMKAFMANCKAFVFPSFYEGFGIPPLEAASTGARIVVSKAASLPELFEDCAYYINPYDSAVSLETVLEGEVKAADGILKKYSWKASAERIYRLLKKGE